MKSTHTFDLELDKISHYTNFPAMKPFIGSNYGANNSKKIMLIGESNYLPPSSTINESADHWYKSKQADLTYDEVQWIHCRNLLMCDWKSAGHMLYRELELRLSESLDCSTTKAMNNIVFMNGFQRPAPQTGNSIRNFCREIDFKMGAETIDEVIKITNPDLVIFVSKLAWDSLKHRLSTNSKQRTIDFTCHPGTGGRYWHKKSYLHGVEKFRKLIAL